MGTLLKFTRSVFPSGKLTRSSITQFRRCRISYQKSFDNFVIAHPTTVAKTFLENVGLNTVSERDLSSGCSNLIVVEINQSSMRLFIIIYNDVLFRYSKAKILFLCRWFMDLDISARIHLIQRSFSRIDGQILLRDCLGLRHRHRNRRSLNTQ